MLAILRPGRAYCLTGEQAVFLDLAADRYFALSPQKTAALSACLNEDRSQDLDPAMRYFLDEGILVPQSAERAEADLPDIMLPARDAPPWRPRSIRPGSVARAMAVLLASRLKQKFRPATLFADGLDSRWSKAKSGHACGADIHDLIEAMARAERLLPVKLNCVSRTRALKHFLKGQGIDSDMIVGVRLHPFSAHCWLQVGDMVLNDTLEGIAPYTVIRGIA